jgi:hypothetical protein
VTGKANSHDDDYWDRLKKQFRTCQYDHSGAYAAQNRTKSSDMKNFERNLENTERNVQSASYQHLRKSGYFHPRPSDRLLPLTRLKVNTG